MITRLPIVALTPRDAVYSKIISNLEEVKARDGKVIALATEGDKNIRSVSDEVIVPKPPDLPSLQMPSWIRY